MPNIAGKAEQSAERLIKMIGEVAGEDAAKVAKWISENGKISATSVDLMSKSGGRRALAIINETNKRDAERTFDSKKLVDEYVWSKNQKATTTPSSKNVLDRIMLEKRQGISKDRSYQFDKFNGQNKEDLKALNNVGTRGEIAKRYDIQRQEEMNMNQPTNAVHSYNVNKFAKGTSTIGHNKYHAKGTGALVTTGVVSSLSNSRGQQTNAQLYGQDSIPGM